MGIKETNRYYILGNEKNILNTLKEIKEIDALQEKKVI